MVSRIASRASVTGSSRSSPRSSSSISSRLSVLATPGEGSWRDRRRDARRHSQRQDRDRVQDRDRRTGARGCRARGGNGGNATTRPGVILRSRRGPGRTPRRDAPGDAGARPRHRRGWPPLPPWQLAETWAAAATATALPRRERGKRRRTPPVGHRSPSLTRVHPSP